MMDAQCNCYLLHSHTCVRASNLINLGARWKPLAAALPLGDELIIRQKGSSHPEGTIRNFFAYPWLKRAGAGTVWSREENSTLAWVEKTEASTQRSSCYRSWKLCGSALCAQGSQKFHCGGSQTCRSHRGTKQKATFAVQQRGTECTARMQASHGNGEQVGSSRPGITILGSYTWGSDVGSRAGTRGALW